jgi:TPR repeat protein
MEAFLDECRKADLPPSQLSELEALVQQEYASQAEQAKNWPEAVEHYASAAKAFPHSDVELWNGYAHAALQLPAPRGCATAMPVLANLEEIRGYADQPPADRAWAHANRAFCFGQNHDQKAAIAEARLAADLGNSWAQTELGEVLWHGSVAPQDQKGAIELWQKAAASGDERAAKLLKGIHEHP